MGIALRALDDKLASHNVSVSVYICVSLSVDRVGRLDRHRFVTDRVFNVTANHQHALQTDTRTRTHTAWAQN